MKFNAECRSTVAEKYIRVFRSRFAVRRHLCLAFFVRASPFAVRASRFAVRRHLCLAFFVRASRFAVRSHLCLAFHVRASRFALSHSRFVLSRSCFAVRSSWFVVRGGFYGGPLGPFGRIAKSRKLNCEISHV